MPYRFWGLLDSCLAAYEGRELSEVIAEGHGVRSDGKTLISQPHTNKDSKLWTLDDIKKIGCVFADPLKAL